METNKVRKILSGIVSLVLAFSVVTGTATNLVPGKAENNYGIVASAASKKVALSATSATIYVGKTKTLKVKNTTKKVTWSTGNKKVATVNSKGVVTAKGVGTTYIYAKVGGKTYKCKVTVIKVEISATSKTLYYKGTTTLKMKNTTAKVTWSSGNTKVATVNSSGKVTAKGLGSTYIYAKVSGKTYKCKVTVKDRDQSATRSFKVNGGGSFVKGESTAKVSVKVTKYDAAKAYVYILNSSGDTVYKKTISNLTKNKLYYFNWNGKNSDGKYVSGDSYRVLVKVGTTKVYTSYLKFISKNDFAGGNGSKTNPFEVASVSQFKKITKYPSAYFIQTADLDFDYNAVGGFFSKDQPLNGVYDGNNKTISNISSNQALFEYVGEKGTIKNVVMNSCSVVGNKQALLATYNYGKIQNCNIDGIVSVNTGEDGGVGHIVYCNNGTISTCISQGLVSSTATGNGSYVYAGGVVDWNRENGKIISCVSHVQATARLTNSYNNSFRAHAGGIAATNDGLITGCEADGIIIADGYNDWDNPGGIAGENRGQISGCYYTGESNINITGTNTGVVS